MIKIKFHIQNILNFRVHWIFISLVSIVFFSAYSLFSSEDNDVPRRIILNLTANPSQEMAITWRTGPRVRNSQAEFMIATPKSSRSLNAGTSDPYENVKSVNAISKTLRIDNNTFVKYNSVILKNLEPDTLYQYRVGNVKTWSEWSHFKTSGKRDEPFKFIYLGDAQNNIKSFYSRVFHSAYSAAPDSRFILLTGDLVDLPWKDELWGELFYAAGWIARRIPFIMVPGNHEYYYAGILNKSPRKPGKLWYTHLTLPENGPAGLDETAYHIDFQGVRLIMLDGNEKLAEQAEWMENLLSNNKNRWTIVAIHQPFYSTGLDRDNPEIRGLFIPVIDKYSVDLVLQGHDHTYGRTYKLRNGKVVSDSEKGTVFVVSIGGPKFYILSEKHQHLMKKVGTDVQLFQVIYIEKNILKFESRTVTNGLYDSFEIRKK